MNIAFICGGLPRLNQECIDNFYEKIISKLNPEKNYFKFFISVDQEHFEYWNSLDYKVDRNIKITDKNLIFEKCIFSQLIDLPLEIPCYYHQYRHLFSSFLNLKNENIKFDCIFKIRLDMMYCDYFEFDVSLIEDNCLYTPCKEFHEENNFNPSVCCNDQFYFGNYNTMSKIMNFSFDESFKIYDYFTVESYLSLELLLRKYLHFKSLNLKLISNFIYYKHLDLPGKRGFIPECAK